MGMDLYLFAIILAFSAFFLYLSFTQAKAFAIFSSIMGAVIVLFLIYTINADGGIMLNGFGSSASITLSLINRTQIYAWTNLFLMLFVYEAFFWITMIFRARK